MDGSMIDRLTHAMQGASRRHALRAALGGAAVAMASLMVPALGSDAKKDNKKKKKKKRKKRTCQAFASGARCETNLQCCPNETNRICAFANGMIPGPTCCGTLGATCATFTDCCRGFSCFEGRCVFAG